MFERAEAIRFDKKMGTGRTKPLLLVCECDGSEVEVVAKFSEGCSIGGLVREAMAAMLGLDLGLPVPAPYLVELTDEFIETIPDAATAQFLRSGDRYGFGSRRLPDGYAAWIPPSARMSATLELEAQQILAFDCWVTNGDRRVANPNVLTNGKQFAVFDHELALMTTLNLFWQEPWLVNALEAGRPPVDHVFFDHLRRRAEYQLDDICECFRIITDERVNEYVGALPPSWVVDPAEAQKIQAFIMQLRDNITPARTEFSRAIS